MKRANQMLDRQPNEPARTVPPTLFIVATPIGNLNDLSSRALEVLSTVDFIICEDTRVTTVLLQHYEIHTPFISYHQHSRLERIDEIVRRLSYGESAALVSDAGTPGIADPGGLLVAAVREQAPTVAIVTVPGPAAFAAAASLSGMAMERFLFLGFLPHKKGRQTLFRRITASDVPVIFYESPHRLMKALESLVGLLDPDRRIVVCKELTKIHEATVTGSAAEVQKHFLDHPDIVRGEFVIIVAGA